jgi:hypothetical protein
MNTCFIIQILVITTSNFNLAPLHVGPMVHGLNPTAHTAYHILILSGISRPHLVAGLLTISVVHSPLLLSTLSLSLSSIAEQVARG